MNQLKLCFLIVALLLTSVGQATASITMTCADSHAEVMSNNHHQMMPSMTMENHAEMDCCQDDEQIDCSCPMNACTSHSVIAMTALFSIASATPEKLSLYALSNHEAYLSSLYRPPMSA